MSKYLCQLCYKIVTYGENHPCLFYKSADNVYCLPPLDEKNKNTNDVQDNLMQISSKLCSNTQKEGWKEIENLSFTPALFSAEESRTIAERSSENALVRNPHGASSSSGCNVNNARRVENRLEETASFKGPSKNAEYEKDSRGTRKKISNITGFKYKQKKSGSKTSNLLKAEAIEECGVSLDSKWQSFNKDKYAFMSAVVTVSENKSSDNQIISGNSNLLRDSGLLLLNNNTTIGTSEDLRDDKISPEIICEVSNNSEEKQVNEDKSESFITGDTAVPGPSRICPSSKIFVCDICFIQFENEIKLHDHNRTHTGEKYNECDIYEENVSSKGNRNTHHSTHTGDNRFQCDVCGKKFTQIGNLNVHYRIHTGEKPFECDICGQKFTVRKTRDDHYRTHTGEKPFECDICGRKFSCKSNLKVHYRTHTG